MESLVRYLLSVQIEITSKCNLACVYCFNNSGPVSINEMPKELISKIIGEACDMGVCNLVISGGEPTLSDNLWFSLDEANAGNLSVTLDTNGTLISLEMAKRLTGYNISLINLNIEGSSNLIHDRLRGRGSFELLVKGINNLSVVGLKSKILPSFVVTKENFYDVSDYLGLLGSLGFKRLRLITFKPLGRGQNNSALEISKNEYIRFFDEVYSASVANHIEIMLSHSLSAMSLKTVPSSFNMTACEAGNYAITVDSLGLVYPCPFLKFDDFVCGSVKKQTLMEIWSRSEIINKLNKYMPNNSACNSCAVLTVCKGGCKASMFLRYGSLVNKDPRCDDFRAYFLATNGRRK